MEVAPASWSAMALHRFFIGSRKLRFAAIYSREFILGSLRYLRLLQFKKIFLRLAHREVSPIFAP